METLRGERSRSRKLPMNAAPDPVVNLTDDQCWAVLSGCKVGRLVTCVDRHPEIFPINFVTDGRSIVFRTAEGTKLFTVTIGSEVAFEVDGWDGTGGWSVIARGAAEEVRGDSEIDHLETLPLRPWVPIVKTHWVRIVPTEVTGRQFHFGPEPEKDHSLNSR